MISKVLHSAANNGRILLVFGLIAGVTLPELALVMRDYLPFLITLLLFLNAFRLGTSATVGSPEKLKLAILVVLVLQLVLPCLLVIIFMIMGLDGPTITAITIMASASSITGAFNLTSLLGHDPAVSQRLLIIGTAMVPVTVIPVFLLSPNLGDPELVFGTAARLLAVIGSAAGLAHILRSLLDSRMTESHFKAVDGMSVIVMSVFVIGLMSAFGPAVFSRPIEVLVTLLIVFTVNLGLQIACYVSLSSQRFDNDRVGISVVAGNRNMALFLTALPASVTDPLLLYIACYQLPMYLTPIVMKRFYSRGIEN